MDAAHFEVGYYFTPGAKTGQPPPAKVRNVTKKTKDNSTAAFLEALDDIRVTRAGVDPIIQAVNQHAAALGFKPIAAHGYFVDHIDAVS